MHKIVTVLLLFCYSHCYWGKMPIYILAFNVCSVSLGKATVYGYVLVVL